MKKITFVFIFVFLIINIIFAKQTILIGENNLQQLIGQKTISVYLTFEGTLIYDDPIDVYIKNIAEDGFTLDKNQIMSDYRAEFDFNLSKKGKKWNMKIVDSLNNLEEGLVFIVNYDECVPIPAIGYRGQATVTVYKSNDLKTVILKYKIETFTGWGAIWPRFSFAKNAMYFVQEMTAFMRKIK